MVYSLKKRIFSGILVVIMCMSMMPTSVYANDATKPATTQAASETAKETKAETTAVQTQKAESTSTTQNSQEKADAIVEVLWSDNDNIAKRRITNGNELLKVYADGVCMSKQPQITLLEDKTVSEYGIDTYTYSIKNLPVTKEDGVTKINYTVREDGIPKGYVEFDNNAVKNADNNTAGKILAAVTSSDKSVILNIDNGTYKADKKFGNYLAQYSVKGTVNWRKVSDSVEKADMESWFKNSFKIVNAKDSSAYQSYKVNYKQSSDNDDCWEFTVEGLFKTVADGSKASYKIVAHNVENYNTYNINNSIDSDNSAVNVIYEEKVNNKRMMTPAIVNDDQTEQPIKSAESFENQMITIMWVDNVDSDKRPDITSNIKIKSFTTKIDGEDKVIEFSEENVKNYLGMTQEQFDNIALAKLPDTGTYDVYTVKLPSKVKYTTVTTVLKTDEEGNTVLDEEGKPVTEEQSSSSSENVSWNIIQEPIISNKPDTVYLPVTKGNDIAVAEYTNVWINREVTNTKFNVEIKQNAYTDTQKKSVADFSEQLDLYANINGTEVKLGPIGALDSSQINTAFNYMDATTISTALNNAGTTISQNDKSQPGLVLINNLPKYDDNKVEIIYTLRKSSDNINVNDIDENDNSGDYFKTTYNNDASVNFSSVNDKCHDNGILNLILSGETDYKATKLWLDNGEYARPTVSYDLWRYTDKGDGSSYQQAARSVQVQSKNYTIAALDKDVENKPNSYTFGFDKLDKYDPEGYRYVYLTRESMGSCENQYEIVYLAGYTDEAGSHTSVIAGDEKVDEEVYITTDKTTGKTSSVTVSSIDKASRDSSDKSIYDNSIVANRITGTTDVEWTKKWNAAQYQDKLENVKVTIGVYSKLEKEDDGEYSDDGSHDMVIENFYAENLMQNGTISLPKFDDLGQPYAYKCYEKAISENGKNVTIDERSHFKLDCNKLSENDKSTVDEYFVSKSEVIGNKTVITNSLEGEIKYSVDKLWQQSDGTYSKNPPSEDAEVDVKLYQNGASYDKPAEGTLTLTSKTSPQFYGEFTVPKYDSNGKKYDYLAIENDVRNLPTLDGDKRWTSSTDYNVTDNGKFYDCQIKNHITGGVYASIWIQKEWLDDGDAPSRQDVKVAVYRVKKDGETQDKQIKSSATDGYYTLNSANNWRLEVNVLEEDAQKNKTVKVDNAEYYIREVAVGGNSTVSFNKRNGTAASDVASAGAPVLFTGSNNSAATVDYIECKDNSGNVLEYEAYYKRNSGLYKEYVVVNRRVGTINYAVTKNWIDYNNIYNSREGSKAKIKLSASSYDGYSSDFVIISDTTDYVQIKDVVGYDGIEYIKDSSNNNVTSVQNVTEEDGKIYYYNNLPKYDALGRVIHYSIDEIDLTNEYSSDIRSEYKNGTNKDTVKVTVTNTRTGSKDVKFYKMWKDVYAFENGLRPDIYLDLYVKKYKEDGTFNYVKYDGYPERNWSGVSGEDEKYCWVCTFPGLPKYDANGREKEYFAVEKSTANMSALEYADVRVFSAKPDLTSANSSNEITGENVPTADGKKLLPENGWFLNQLKGKVTIAGKKVWKNVPFGVPPEDMPTLQILVGRDIINQQNYEATSEKDVAAYTELKTTMSSGSSPTFNIQYIKKENADGEVDKNATYTKADELPKYDANGNIYYYKVSEEIVAESSSGSISGSSYNDAYESLPGEVNNYIITNAYDINLNNTGYLKVTKKWSLDQQYLDLLKDGKYPGVEFKLYRQYITNSSDPDKTESIPKMDADGNVLTGDDAGEITVTKPELVETQILTSNENAESSVEFTNSKLRLRAPNGNPYYYYVEETIIMGYETTTVLGSNIPISQKSKYVTLLDNREEDVKENIDFFNGYNKGKAEITGTKVWEDYDDAYGTRPSTSAFAGAIKLYRYADAQDIEGGAAAITRSLVAFDTTDSGTGPKLKVEQGKDSNGNDNNTFTYTITNLDKYAPNGMPWKYTVEEDTSDTSPLVKYTAETGKANAKNTAEAYKKEETPDYTNVRSIEMSELKNSFYTSATFIKTWSNDNNTTSQRPDKIKAKLQYKLDGDVDNSWKDVSLVNLKASGLDESVTELKFDTEYEITVNQSGNTEFTTDKNLPSYIGTGTSAKKISYRFVETEIDGMSVSVTDATKSSNTPNYNLCGSYQPTHKEWVAAGTTGTGDAGTGYETPVTEAAKYDTTVVDNRLVKAELQVTKVWAADSNNDYNTRPEKIVVKLQKYLKADMNDTTDNPDSSDNAKGTWVDVYQVGTDKVVTAEIKPNADGVWEHTFSDLRLYGKETNANGKENNLIEGTYIYRAVEVVKNRSGVYEEKAPDGYAISSENGSKSDNSDIHTYTTKITNTLTPLTTVKVTKKWYKSDGTEDTNDTLSKDPVYVEIVKVVTDSSGKETIVHFDTPKIIELTETTSWNAVVTGLPTLPNTSYTAIEMVKNKDSEGKDTYIESACPGFIKVDGRSKNDVAEYNNNPDNPEYNITIKNIQTEVSFDKMAIGTTEDTSSEIPTDYTVEYTIYARDSVADESTPVATWKKTKDSSQADPISYETTTTYGNDSDLTDKVIKGLPIGTYTVRETKAPAGYEKSKDVIFTIADDGTISLKEGTDKNTATISEKEITLKDTPIKLSINKTDGKNTITPTGTSYAEFKVTGEFADNANTKTISTSTSAGSNGISPSISSLDGLWIAGNTYTFTETKAPDGYEKTSLIVSIRIKEDGSIEEVKTLDADNEEAINIASVTGEGANATTLNIKNDKIEITLDKIADNVNADTRKYLNGAQFELSDVTDSSNIKTTNVEFTGTSYSALKLTGTDIIPMIQGHTYTLKEIKAPEGYILPKDNDDNADFIVTFKIAEDGTLENNVSISDSNKFAGYYKGDAGSTSIILANKYDAVGNLTLSGVKKVENANLSEGFEFSIFDKCDTADDKLVNGMPVLSNSADTETNSVISTVVAASGDGRTVKNDANGKFLFNMHYDMQDMQKADGSYAISKTFTYYITESALGDGHVNYTQDKSVYKAVVTVENVNSSDYSRADLKVTNVSVSKWNKNEKTFAGDTDYTGTFAQDKAVTSVNAVKTTQESSACSLEFVNTYNAVGTFDITGTKTVEKNNLTAFEFGIFTDKACDSDSLVATNKVNSNKVSNTVPGNNADTGEFKFTLNYKMEDLKNTDGSYADSKEFTYYIKETSAAKPGYTMDNSIYKVTVVVTNDKTEGKLKAAIKQESNGTYGISKSTDGGNTFTGVSSDLADIRFTNTYGITGTGTVTGTKVVDNGNVSSGFEFSIFDKCDTADDKLVDGMPALSNSADAATNSVISTVKPSDTVGSGTADNGRKVINNADGLFSFRISYDMEDMKDADGKYVSEKSFEYYIKESSVGNYSNGDEHKNYSLDTSVYKVTVTVTDETDSENNTRKLNITNKTVEKWDKESKSFVTKNYTDSEKEALIFTNKYQPDNGQVTINGLKKVLDNYISEFNFGVFTDEECETYASKSTPGIKTNNDKAENTAVNTVTEGSNEGTFAFDFEYNMSDLIDTEYSGSDVRYLNNKTFTYYIKETTKEDDKSHYEFDAAVYKVNIKVTNNEKDGKLDAKIISIEKKLNDETNFVQVTSVDGTESNPLVFTNKYQASDIAKFTAGKQLEGNRKKAIQDGEFEFKAQCIKRIENDGFGNEVVIDNPTGSNAVENAKYVTEGKYSSEFGTIVFNGIKYDQGDSGKVFIYKITETTGSDTTIEYSDAVYYAKVSVTNLFVNGQLEVNVEYYRDEECSSDNKINAADVLFTNKYKAEGVKQISMPPNADNASDANYISITKNLTGDNLKAGQFSFELSDSEGNVLQTVTNKANGQIDLDSIRYTQEDIGKTYSYTLKEVIASDEDKDGVTYDTSVYTITVKVEDSDESNGKLNMTVSAYKGTTISDNTKVDKIVFENKYAAKGNVEFTGIKTVTNGSLVSGFKFDVYNSDNSGAISVRKASNVTDAEGRIVSDGIVTNDADGNIKLGFYYTNEDLKDGNTYLDEKTFTYYIKEQDTEKPGYTKDKKIYRVSVLVKNSREEFEPENPQLQKLDVSVSRLEVSLDDGKTYTDAQDLAFNNIYKAEGLYVLDSAKKELSGRSLREGEFTYEIKNEFGAVVSKGKNAADGKINFESIDYTELDIDKTYIYKVSEINNSISGVTYDTTEFEFEVMITDNGDGTLKAVSNIGENDITFKNIYNASGSYTITGTKELQGRNYNTDEEFKYEVAENGVVKATGHNSKNGAITFDSISYTEKDLGMHTYTVSEVKQDSVYVKYDSTQYEVKVNVTDNGDGTLKTEADYNGMDVKFTNVYKETEVYFYKKGLINETCADGESEIKADELKVLEGVEFNVYSADDKETVIKKVVSDSTGKVTLTGLMPGKYMIKEIKTLDGYILDNNEYYATVTEDTFEGLRDSNGNLVKDNTVINDIYRATISLMKVDEKNPEMKLPNSTYGLYRKVENDEKYLCSAVTDADGMVYFKGVCMNNVYVIRELQAPDGSYVSEKPIEMQFKVSEDGVVKVDKVSTGDGTAQIDAVTGEVTWYEPPVEVYFAKLDKNSNYIDGALLQVVDSDGKEVVKFTSSFEKKKIGNTFVIGQKYKLIELTAPDGYTVAEPVEFEISDEKVGPGKDKTIIVTMKDELTNITIAKEDESGNRLSGAAFEITGTFADETTKQEIKPDNKGVNLSGKLVVGNTYVIKEVTAPTGYQLLAGTVSFTLKDDGTINLTNTDNAYVSGNTLVIKNKKKEVTKPTDSTEKPTASTEKPVVADEKTTVPTDKTTDKAEVNAEIDKKTPMLPVEPITSSMPELSGVEDEFEEVTKKSKNTIQTGDRKSILKLVLINIASIVLIAGCVAAFFRKRKDKK